MRRETHLGESLTRIGVTGHMNLTPSSEQIVREALRDALAPYVDAGLTGVSCIAAGADSIFAQTVLDLGGQLEVILPSSDYRREKVKPAHEGLFDSLIGRASSVQTMPYEVANRHAYEAANNALLESCEILLAVWDGKPAVDQGGTAAFVNQAQSLGRNVQVVWPEGAGRQ